MTESEWLSSANASEMYESVRGSATTRQNQFLIAGCFRLVWDLLTDDRYENFVQILEAVAEDRASHEQYVDAVDELPMRGVPYPPPAVTVPPDWLGRSPMQTYQMGAFAGGPGNAHTGVLNFRDLPKWYQTVDDAIKSATRSDVGGVMIHTRSAAALKAGADYRARVEANQASHPIHSQILQLQQEHAAELQRIQDLRHRGIGDPSTAEAQAEKLQQQLEARTSEFEVPLKYEYDEVGARERFRHLNLQACLVRCIFGNPTRPIVIEPTWRTSTVLGIARGIRLDAAYDRMPILADALQDAGCEDVFVLAHARHDIGHCRGCCLLDEIQSNRE